GLQHVQGFLATYFANDDPVRPHAQRIDDQLALPYGPAPFHVRRPALQANNVFLLQLEFGGVFDGDNVFGVPNVAAHHIQQRRLAGAGTAGDDNIELRPYCSLQDLENRGGNGTIGEQLLGANWNPSEAADRENWAIHRERRDDD